MEHHAMSSPNFDRLYPSHLVERFNRRIERFPLVPEAAR
jgi:hypothetical protein